MRVSGPRSAWFNGVALPSDMDFYRCCNSFSARLRICGEFLSAPEELS